MLFELQFFSFSLQTLMIFLLLVSEPFIAYVMGTGFTLEKILHPSSQSWRKCTYFCTSATLADGRQEGKTAWQTKVCAHCHHCYCIDWYSRLFCCKCCCECFSTQCCSTCNIHINVSLNFPFDISYISFNISHNFFNISRIINFSSVGIALLFV